MKILGQNLIKILLENWFHKIYVQIRNSFSTLKKNWHSIIIFDTT